MFESGSFFLVLHSCTQTSFQGPFLPEAKCLQFPCISLYQSLLKTIGFPIADHAQILIWAETVFNFLALAYTGACSKVWVIADHAQILILTETVFNFLALGYTRVWLEQDVILLQTIHKY